MSQEPQFPPTLEQLLQGVTSAACLRQRLASFGKAQLINIIVLMWALTKNLKAAVSMDSHNSSKPPSSDGYTKPAPKSLRPRSGRKTGGQPGHKGYTLEKVEKPDHTVPVKTAGRCSCGRCLSKAKVVDMETRQVFDLPEPQELETTEYQGEVKECECGRIHRPQFPWDVSHPTQYGPRVQALVTYFNQRQQIPYGRTQETLRDVFGVELSQGTIKNILARGHSSLQDFGVQAKNTLIVSDVVGFDETGMRCMKELHWLHVASTDEITYYHFDDSHGVESMNRMGILPHFKGTAVHDGLPAYHTYTNCKHALCNSHHLRELIFAEEQYQQKWARQMIDFLVKVNDEVDAAKRDGKDSLPTDILKAHSDEYDSILKKGMKEVRLLPSPTPGKRGRKGQHKGKNLLDRLVKHKDAALAFMYCFLVPFTNNARERDIRPAKGKQKISGCFRSLLGGEMFARYSSYVSTALKQGHRPMRALTALFSGDWKFIRGLTR